MKKPEDSPEEAKYTKASHRPNRVHPIVSIVGNSGVGKTTLIEKLIPEFTARGFRVGTIKHDVHGFQMDKPGKDSWRHKQAGASTAIISSPHQIGMVMDVDYDHPPAELVHLLSNTDIVLLEGYKRAKNPKIEIFRPEVHAEPVCANDEYLIAVVSNAPAKMGAEQFSLDDIKGLAEFILKYFHLFP